MSPKFLQYKGVFSILFYSIQFILFLPITALLYYLLPKKTSWAWLLAASYFFYFCWNPFYMPVLLAVTAITYISGLLLERANALPDTSKRARYRKICVVNSILLTLSPLFFYKYLNFFFESFWQISGWFGTPVPPPVWDLMLPAGISFYTLQTITYTVSVYRGEIKAEHHLGKYALFAAFFPQITSGPINRAKTLLPQFQQKNPLLYQNIKHGILQMLWGYFQKLVVADRINLYVNLAYAHPDQTSGAPVLLAVLFYGIQIYADFAGYSNIALGAARIMGFTLSKNFEQPYFSRSVQEFWHRWHMSLSSWLRDYVYIPLGGSRCSPFRKYLNLLVTFLVSGLWHGAGASFILWGMLHALYQILGELLRPLREKIYTIVHLSRDCPFAKGMQRIITYVLVDFAWVFFRSVNWQGAFLVLGCAVDFQKGLSLTDFLEQSSAVGMDIHNFYVILLGIIALFLFDLVAQRTNLFRLFDHRSAMLQGVLAMLLLLIVLIYGVYGPSYHSSEFIYSHF